MVISEEDELEFRSATRCSICTKRFDECDEKVRDAKTQNIRNKNNQLFRSLVLGWVPKNQKNNPRRLFGE